MDKRKGKGRGEEVCSGCEEKKEERRGGERGRFILRSLRVFLFLRYD
jgi:hypothetical protein